MNRRQTTRSNQSIGKTSRYTVNGLLLTNRLNFQRIYLPTYQLKSNGFIDLDHIHLIIKNSVIKEIVHSMPVFDPIKAKDLVKNVCDEIKYRIQYLNYDRMRTIVIANVIEKAHQGINWQMDALINSTTDQWTSFQHETATYIVNIFTSLVYWD